MACAQRVAAVAAVTVVVIGSFGAGAFGQSPAGTKGQPKAPDPPAEPRDEITGEYVGTFTSPAGKVVPAVACVAAERRRGQKGQTHRASLRAVESGLIEKTVLGPKAKVVLSADLRGAAAGGVVALTGRDATGRIAAGKLTAQVKGGTFALERFGRKSPTELAPPPPGAVVLLPYEKGKATSQAAWTHSRWPVFSDGSAMVKGGTNRTKRQFRNFKLHLEFRIPMQSRGSGNSGVYILDRYEIQILNSFGRGPSKGSCAAVYQTFPPSANASLPLGRWQTYDITFRAPKMAGDKAVKLPVVTVVHNGVTVHKDVEVPHATGNARSKGHAGSGPIQLQDHGNPVRFRNIWLQEMK